MTEYNGHMPVGTNMMVDYLSNSDKIKISYLTPEISKFFLNKSM